MNEEAVRLWIQKADEDFEAGKILFQTDSPITGIVCFHMQQCAEKYLKAFLIYHGQAFPRTHSLPVLIQHCAQIDPPFQMLKEAGVRKLSRYATAIRYGEEPYRPDIDETQQAIELAQTVRRFVRQALQKSGFVFEAEENAG